MTWISYNNSLLPLINKFGAYSASEIQDGWFYVRHLRDNQFSAALKQLLMSTQRPEIKSILDHLKDNCEEQINCAISEGYLDSMLEASDCASLQEYIFKQINQQFPKSDSK